MWFLWARGVQLYLGSFFHVTYFSHKLYKRRKTYRSVFIKENWLVDSTNHFNSRKKKHVNSIKHFIIKCVPQVYLTYSWNVRIDPTVTLIDFYFYSLFFKSSGTHLFQLTYLRKRSSLSFSLLFTDVQFYFFPSFNVFCVRLSVCLFVGHREREKEKKMFVSVCLCFADAKG